MFNQYPYLNLNDLNLDYLLNEIKSMYNEVTNFVSINAIKYADPIQWNITNQYEKNTVVIDPLTGTAYISVAAVPSGVALTRTEYWTVVFDLGSFVTRAAKNFTTRYEEETTTTATFSTTAGEWLVWGDTLYIANVNITAGDSYVVDGNIRRITIEEVKNTIMQLISDNYDALITMIGSLDDLTTSDKTSIVAAINSLKNDIEDETTARQQADNEILNTINTKPFPNELSLQYIGSLVSLDSRYTDFSSNRYDSVIQGMCINNDGNLVCVRADESNRDNYGTIDIFNTNGIRLSTHSNIEIGHGNSITYANGYYYIGWLYDVNNGVYTNSNKITKISEDFSNISIITGGVRVSAISYDIENDNFYIFDQGRLYVYDSDDFSTPITTITLDESGILDTAHNPNMSRQNGLYYNGYWLQIYVFPTILVWYDLTTAKPVKIYNYPRRLKYNGMSTNEIENIVYNASDNMFYSTAYGRCGEGDVSTNTFVKYSPYINAIDNDNLYYGRHGVELSLYVDPSINDNSFMNGSSTYPFKYLQLAVDFAIVHTDLNFQILVRTSNNYLGTVKASSINGLVVNTDSGYSVDVNVTIPIINLLRCNSIVVFHMHCTDFNCDYCSNIQISSATIDNRLRINRTYDADVQLCTINTFLARICGLSLYNNTITTYTEDGTVVYKQENVAYLDCGHSAAITIPAEGYLDYDVTYKRVGNRSPRTVASIATDSTSTTYLSSLTCFVANNSATGCKIRIMNTDTTARTCAVNWISFA